MAEQEIQEEIEAKKQKQLEDEIEIPSSGECLIDGRAIPVNSKELWAKMTPAEHYHRLCQFDDIEAWEHLGDLLWVCIVKDKRIYRVIKRGGVTVEDQVRTTMSHILRKMKEGALHLDDDGKFYGLIKIIAINLMRDVLRLEKVEDQDSTPFDDNFIKGLILSDSSSESVENKLVEKRIWEAVVSRISIKNPKHRRALELSLQMKMGLVDLKNNSELTARLSEEFDEPVTYQQASGWVSTGMKKLREYLLKTGVGWEKVKKN